MEDEDEDDFWSVETRMSELSCANCGMPFMIPLEWEQQRRRDNREFFCPNGHVQSFQKQEPKPPVQEVEEEKDKDQKEGGAVREKLKKLLGITDDDPRK